MFEFVGREVDGALYVFYRRAHDGTRRDRFILSRIDGPPLVAWDTAAFSRENAPCVATPIDGPVFGLTLWWSPTDSTFRNYVSIGTPSYGPEWRTPVVNFLGAPWDRALIPYVSAYGRDVALSLGPTLWRSAPETREFVALAHGAALQGTIEAVQLHGEQSWFLLTQVDRSSVSQTNTSLAVVEARRRSALRAGRRSSAAQDRVRHARRGRVRAPRTGSRNLDSTHRDPLAGRAASASALTSKDVIAASRGCAAPVVE